MAKKTYTLSEAAVWLSISRTKMYTLVRSGQIPAKQVKRRWIVREDDLVRWWVRQYVQSDVWFYPQL